MPPFLFSRGVKALWSLPFLPVLSLSCDIFGSWRGSALCPFGPSSFSGCSSCPGLSLGFASGPLLGFCAPVLHHGALRFGPHPFLFMPWQRRALLVSLCRLPSATPRSGICAGLVPLSHPLCPLPRPFMPLHYGDSSGASGPVAIWTLSGHPATSFRT